MIVGRVAERDANVLELALDFLPRRQVVGAVEVRTARQHVVGVVVGVAAAVLGCGLGGREVRLTELAHGLQQAVARAAGGLVGDDERLVDEREDPVEHLPLLDTVARDDGFGRLDRERPREDRAAVEDPPLRLVEQLVRPAHRGVERAVPAGREPVARRQQPQPLVESAGDVGRRHAPHPRGGQLDRERHVVEPLADLDDRPFVLGGEREVGAGHPGPVDEQLDAVARHAAAGPTAARPPTRARPARRAAPGWSRAPSTVVDDVRPSRSTTSATSASRCSQLSITTNASRPLAHPHSVSSAGSPRRSGTPNASRIVAADQRAFLERGERREPRSVAELGRDLGRDLQRETRLADAAGTGQRHEPLGGEQRRELLHLVGAADEAGPLHRQVPRQLVERAQRRELAGAELPDRAWARRGRGRRCSPRLRSDQSGHQLRGHARRAAPARRGRRP